MKRSILSAFICAATCMVLFSCKKDTIDTASQSSSLVSSDPTLSIFSAILDRSGDVVAINSYSAILAPVDSAFISAGITSSVAAALSPATCDSIIKYYAISGNFAFGGSSNVETAFNSQLGVNVDADSTSGQLYLDGASVLSSTSITNGTATIYKLSKFIALPVSSVAQLTSNNASLTLYNEALNRTGFAATLTSGNYTLFAPTNDAFNRAGFPDLASIDAADINYLNQVLLYNTIGTSFFANDLLQQTSLTTLQSGSVQVTNTNGVVQLIGNSSPTLPADVISNGQSATGNVWVYKTDNLLLP